MLRILLVLREDIGHTDIKIEFDNGFVFFLSF